VTVELSNKELRWLQNRLRDFLHGVREGIKEGVDYSEGFVDFLETLLKKLENQSSSR
jgi:hypothetical protein